jgi:hypothetical protein
MQNRFFEPGRRPARWARILLAQTTLPLWSLSRMPISNAITAWRTASDPDEHWLRNPWSTGGLLASVYYERFHGTIWVHFALYCWECARLENWYLFFDKCRYRAFPQICFLWWRAMKNNWSFWRTFRNYSCFSMGLCWINTVFLVWGIGWLPIWKWVIWVGMFKLAGYGELTDLLRMPVQKNYQTSI